jgi:Kef-type K+ transport system membrane component KefB
LEDSTVISSFFLIFSGAAVLASIALYSRQPLIIAYLGLGAIIGPFGLNYINDPGLLSELSEIGIIFLLFLLGLDMQPSTLIRMLQKASFVAIGSSFIFASTGFLIGYSFGFTMMESLIIGIAMMFSSTIIGIKLLPTTVLHHKHTGELVVGLLLLQDVIAIIVLLMMGGDGASTGVEAVKSTWQHLLMTLLMLPLLIVVSFAAVKYLVIRLLVKFDRFHEYIFLVTIGWCLGIAELARYLGLSTEIGAFIAGISLATSPISQYIAEQLKPLRDFFLILFFFSIGAKFNFELLHNVIFPSILLAGLMLAIKPLTFKYLLRFIKENKATSLEVGVRLGQISEFSLLIAFMALDHHYLGENASVLIQATAIITFILNSYIVILNYPSPIAISDKLRRD